MDEHTILLLFRASRNERKLTFLFASHSGILEMEPNIISIEKQTEKEYP